VFSASNRFTEISSAADSISTKETLVASARFFRRSRIALTGWGGCGPLRRKRDHIGIGIMKLAVTAAVLFSLPATLAYAACDPAEPAKKPNSQYVIQGATVYDKASNLTWQRCSVGQTWKDGAGCTGEVKVFPWAKTKELERDGWRLPTEAEIETLLSPTCSNPSINEEVFPNMNMKDLYYWSGTGSGAYASYANFVKGFVSTDAADEPYAVRLVRSGK